MIVRTYSVFCDAPNGDHVSHAPGCAQWIVETTRGAAEARREARRDYGWRRHDGKDLSPECYRAATDDALRAAGVPASGPEEISP